MGYRVCISTGRIHAHGANFKKVCQKSNIQEGNYKDFLTKGEAEAFVREKRKKLSYCKFCDFRDALQEEAAR